MSLGICGPAISLGEKVEGGHLSYLTRYPKINRVADL
jgi:hypothetical protein